MTYKLELEKINEKREKLLAELTITEKILKAFKENAFPLPKQVTYFSDISWIRYEVDTFKQAVEIVKKFSLIPYGILKNGCTSIKPLMVYSDKEREKAGEMSFISPHLVLEKHSFKPYTDNTLVFWALVGGAIFRINIDVKQGLELLADHIYTPKNRSIKKYNYRLPNIRHAHNIKWSTGEKSGRYSVFFHELEDVLSLGD